MRRNRKVGSVDKAVGRTRRAFAKTMVALSAILVLVQFIPLGGFFSTPEKVVKLKRVKVASKKDVPVGGFKVFSYPTQDRPAIIIRLKPGSYQVGNYWEKIRSSTLDSEVFVAYDDICTHLGCPVGWIESELKMGPSCHGARFSPIDGSVLQGPPPRPLPKIRLEIEEDGSIYANGYEKGLPLYGWEKVRLEV